MPKKKITDLALAKKEGRKICAVTACDYATAAIAGRTDMDIILVGDSLGMVSLGYDNTTMVTMDEMAHHAKAVSRARADAVLVVDLPFLSYHSGIMQTMKNVRRLVQEAGADAVKIEGGRELAPLVKKLCAGGVCVFGHIGLLPQSVKKAGGYRIRGKDEDDAQRLLEDALALEKAGAAAIILEGIKAETAKQITGALAIPTIGIGAGPDCDGQVLVLYDLIGLSQTRIPKFVRQYAKTGEAIETALKSYIEDVRSKNFPGPEHCY